MDHTRKVFVTSCPNLVTDSQKYIQVLFCEETLYVLVVVGGPDFDKN